MINERELYRLAFGDENNTMNADQARTIIDIYYSIYPKAAKGLSDYFTMNDDDTVRAGRIAAEGIGRGKPWSSRWVKRKLGPTWGDSLPPDVVA